ncbi:hypothetical protein [Oceanobacillus sp. AG]|uniref:hypothetical protein n=1 Tax=Oceanobacillus sp. AG TaxID=2681969 RepID=UPI0012EC33CB|nr:hypothetical protein [Oceanobacillus sp. AG]
MRIHFIGVLITVQLPGGRMLSTGTASASSEENRFLRGLRTRAFPVGVTVRRATELVRKIILNGNYSILANIALLKRN